MGLVRRVGKDGTVTWYVRFWAKGKEVRQAVGPSKRQAELALAKRKNEIREKKFGLTIEDCPPRPFTDHFYQWLGTYTKTHTKESTYASYETAYRVHLLPFFGKTDIREITREQVKRFIYEKLDAGLSFNSVKGYLAPLSEMFNHAIEDGCLERNPCLRILRTPRKERGERQRKTDFLTREELTLLLAACQEHFPAAYPFILLLARTGLRVGEAVVLQWGDIDWHDRFLRVQRNYVDGKITTTKPSKIRRVDMSRQLTETLEALLLKRKKETLRQGWGEVPLWVFTTKVGTHLDPDNFRSRTWAKIPSKAGLRMIRIHDLRHTFASLLIQQGAPLAYVKEQMGHYSIRVTVDTYGHLVPGGNRAEVDKLDDAVTPLRGKPIEEK